MKGAILLRTIVINDEVILKEQDYVAKFHKRCGYFRCILDPKCGPPMVQWLTVAAADAIWTRYYFICSLLNNVAEIDIRPRGS